MPDFLLRCYNFPISKRVQVISIKIPGNFEDVELEDLQEIQDYEPCGGRYLTLKRKHSTDELLETIEVTSSN